MNIAFYISGKATRLCEIIEDERFCLIKEDLKLVFSDDMKEGENIRNLCVNNEIEWVYFNYKNLENSDSASRKNEMLSDELLCNLNKYKIDYLFVFGHHLLCGKLLEVYKDRIVGFHASLLPHYTGLCGIDQAVRGGSFIIGTSAFLIDAGVDTGNVLVEAAMHVSNFEGNNYNAILHPLVDVCYYIIKVLKEDRLQIYKDKMIIKGADYGKVHFFPEIEK